MKFKTVFFIVCGFGVGFFFGKMPDTRIVLAQTPSLENRGSEFTLENCVTEFAQDRIEKTANGWVFWYVPKSVSGGLNLKLSEVKAESAQHGAHAHPEAEIFFILQGKAEFTLDGKTRVAGENTALFCPPNVSHGIRNVGDSPMRYFVIKSN